MKGEVISKDEKDVEKNLSEVEKQQEDNVNSDSVEDRIEGKQKILNSLSEAIQFYMKGQFPMKTKQAVDNLQHKLEYQLKKLEEKGLDKKIEIYKKVINTIKNDK